MNPCFQAIKNMLKTEVNTECKITESRGKLGKHFQEIFLRFCFPMSMCSLFPIVFLSYLFHYSSLSCFMALSFNLLYFLKSLVTLLIVQYNDMGKLSLCYVFCLCHVLCVLGGCFFPLFLGWGDGSGFWLGWIIILRNTLVK